MRLNLFLIFVSVSRFQKMQFVALPESAVASRIVGFLLGSEPLLNEVVLLLLLIKLHHNKEFNMEYLLGLQLIH